MFPNGNVVRPRIEILIDSARKDSHGDVIVFGNDCTDCVEQRDLGILVSDRVDENPSRSAQTEGEEVHWGVIEAGHLAAPPLAFAFADRFTVGFYTTTFSLYLSRVHHLDPPQIGLLSISDFGSADSIIEIGYQSGLLAADSIVKLMTLTETAAARLVVKF